MACNLLKHRDPELLNVTRQHHAEAFQLEARLATGFGVLRDHMVQKYLLVVNSRIDEREGRKDAGLAKVVLLCDCLRAVEGTETNQINKNIENCLDVLLLKC